MSGLVMGVTVRGKKIAADYSHRRRIRLLVSCRSKFYAGRVPHYAFALNENGRELAIDNDVRAGPTITLQRGQPVGIMVVNRNR